MNKFSRWIFAVLLVTITILFVLGVAFYRSQEKNLKEEIEKDLLAIARLKASEIETWRNERLGDGAVVMKRPFFIETIPKWLNSSDDELTQKLLDQFQVLKRNYDYSDIQLVTPNGKIHLSLKAQLDSLNNHSLKILNQAFESAKPEFTPIHTDKHNHPHLGVIVPFFFEKAGNTVPVGAIILRSNAEKFLFPLIQSWPTPSRTAETLLVCEDNGDVLFLNELRHQKNTALRLRIPLSETHLPAAMAIKGHEGVVQGIDYRGEAVLAVLKAIPNSPWFMVAKIDKSEALAVLNQVSTLILLLLIGLGIISVTVIYAFWQGNEKAHYRKLFFAENERRRIEARYETTLMSIGDGVIATDEKGQVELMNPVAEQLTGWQNEEAKGQHLDEIFQIFKEGTHKKIESPVAKVIRKGQIVGLANHTLLVSRDGTERPVADSGAPILDENGRFSGVVLVFRDQTAERRAQKALLHSQSMLKRTESIAHIGSWEWDFKNDQVKWSDEMFRIFKLNPAEGAPPFADHTKLFFPEDFKHLKQAVEVAITDGKPYHFAIKIKRPDDSVRYCVVRGYPEVDQRGKTISLYGSFQDITEIKKTEMELRRNENLLQRIFDVLPVGLWLADKDGTLLRGNPKGCEIWGLDSTVPLENYKNFKAKSLPSGEIVTRKDSLPLHAITKGETIVHEMREIETFDGKNRTILNYTTPVLDDAGDFEVAIIVNLDISDLHQTQMQLVESEMKFRSYIENAPNGVFVSDENGNYLEVNHAATQMTQYSQAELLKMNFSQLVSPEVQERVRDHFQTLKIQGHASGEFPFVTKSGEKRWWTVDAVKLDGNRFLGFTNDITSRKQAEAERNRLQEQLAQARKMDAIGRLAGGVAHDFNNMLQAIMGNSDMALDETEPGSRLHEHLREIKKAASRSGDLTQQLLAFARKQTIAPKIINLNNTVAGILKMLRRLIGEDIDLAWIPGHNLWSVNIDASQVDQMLANLVVNARDAISGVGKVTIETANRSFDEAYCAEHVDFLPGDYVMLAVSDDGCGMDKQTVAEVFEPFFTTKKTGEGTGLGMATVYGIVKQNQGFINVYSEPGEGTTFKIYLPRSVSQNQPDANPATPGRLKGTETVLIVEDEKSILNMGKRFLKRLGYEVLTANSPTESLELVQNYPQKIHLLITDVVMPEMNGRELAKRLETLQPGIKCLFMSGYTANVIAHHGVLDEGLFFLQKPFSINALSQKVREALKN